MVLVILIRKVKQILWITAKKTCTLPLSKVGGVGVKPFFLHRNPNLIFNILGLSYPCGALLTFTQPNLTKKFTKTDGQ